MAEKDDKGQSGDQKGQGENKDTANNGGQNDKGEDDSGEVKFTPAQQEHINSLLAEERRKEAKKAEKLRKELDGLKNKKGDGDGTKQDSSKNDDRIKEIQDKLAKFESRDVADKICADLKIPKDEREKYIRHVTATDEDEIRDQIKALKQDFAPKRTGAGSNPAKTGKKNPHDEINDFIRSKAGR